MKFYFKKFFLITFCFSIFIGCFLIYNHKTSNNKINIIFDFDSTIVKNETLIDILSLSLNGDEEKIRQIESITNDAMNGFITPKQSMIKRIKFATIKRDIIEEISKKSINNIVDGMVDIMKRLKKRNINIYIVSGGFNDVIFPVSDLLGIKHENVFANDFVYKNDVVLGVKESNILLEEKGKVKLITKLKNDGKIKGKIVMIGDGYTDLEVGLNKVVDDFIGFTGVVKREKVINVANKNGFLIANTTNELLEIIEQKISNWIK